MEPAFRTTHQPPGWAAWTLVDALAVNPNPDGGNTYGVGDATIIKIDGIYYLFCDRETADLPYRVVAWATSDLNEPFEYLGIAFEPRSDESDDWDNYRVQDADVAYIPELNRFVMMCNMMDKDGDPGGSFPGMTGTRVIGTFYSTFTHPFTDPFAARIRVLEGSSVSVSWYSVPGRTYNIRMSTNLMDAVENWQVVASNVPAYAFSNETSQVIDDVESEAAFFRIELLP